MAALDGDFSNWTIGLGGSIIGAVGGFVAALLNRGPALQAAVDARLKTLIDGYEKRVDDLTMEVHSLREEVVRLRVALAQTRASSGLGV